MHKQTRQTWLIGIFTLIVFLAGILGYQYLKGKDLFHTKNTYFAYFDNIGGLYVTNKIVVNGLTIGYVSDLRFASDGSGRILAEFTLPSHIRLQTTTHAEIVNAGLIGGSIVRFYDALGNGPTLLPNDTIPGTSEKPYTETLSTQLSPLLANVDSVLNSFKNVLRVAEQTLSQQRAEAAYQDVQQLLQNLRTTTAALPATIANINNTVKSVGNNLATVQKLVVTTIDSLRLPLQSAMLRADSLLLSTSNIVRNIEAGKGTMGQLIQNESLYHELSSTVRSLDSILTDVQQHPSRYFKFSIF